MTKRRILTAAVILAALLLIGLILFLSVRGRRLERFSGGEDTPYPYAWTENRDGTVLVEPCGEIPAGFGWTVVEADAAVAVAPEQSEEGKTSFLLTPEGGEDCFFILALTGGEDGEEELGRLIMTLEISGTRQRKAAVVGHRLELVENVLRGGESFGAPYRIWTGENGDLELRLTDAEGAEDWKLSVQTPSSLALSGFRTEAGRITAALYSPAPGEAAFVLYSASRGLSLEVSARADGDGTIRASSHEMRRHEDWSGREEGYADAEVQAGALALPEEAEDIRYSSAVLGGGIGAASCVEFRYLGFEWTLYVTSSGGVSRQMEKKIPEEELSTLFLPAGLLIAAFGEDSALAWCDTEERGYLLVGGGEGIDRDALLQTASAVIPAENE